MRDASCLARGRTVTDGGYLFNSPPGGDALRPRLHRLPLHECDHLRLEAHAVEAVDLLDAGRARDVDLGQVVADDVEADEVESGGAQARTYAVADAPLALGEHDLAGGAADVEVRAVLVVARDPRDRAERLAVEHDHALVAELADGRDVLLRHDQRAAVLGDGLQDRVQVPVLP